MTEVIIKIKTYRKFIIHRGWVHRSVIYMKANGVFKSVNKSGERLKGNNRKLGGKSDDRKGSKVQKSNTGGLYSVSDVKGLD